MRRFAALCLGGFFLSSSLFAGALLKERGTFFSQKKTAYLPSADGRWMLIGSPEGPANEEGASMLQLKNQQSNRTIAIKQYERFVEVGWSPDSKAFFLNDAFGSDMESAAVYRPGDRINSLAPLDLDQAILQHDPEAAAAHFDHTYFRAKNWIDPHVLQVEYCGHSTGAAPDHEGYLLYKITLDSKNTSVQQVSRIASHVHETDDNTEECLP